MSAGLVLFALVMRTGCGAAAAMMTGYHRSDCERPPQIAAAGISGFVLGNHVLSSEVVFAVAECHTACLQYTGGLCQSVNFLRADSLCQLNEGTLKDYPDDSVETNRAKYYPIDGTVKEIYTGCSVGSCNGNGECLPDCSRDGHVCLCHPGYSGKDCAFDSATRVPSTPGVTTSATEITESSCNQTLGMESGFITDNNITASSTFLDSLFGPMAAHFGRLNMLQVDGMRPGGWQADSDSKTEWFQVHFQEMTTVSGVVMQGRNEPSGKDEMWLKEYNVLYAASEVTFSVYLDELGQEKKFIGNTDSDTPVTSLLNPPIEAFFVRIRPVSWHKHVSLRLELLGCTPSSN